MRKRYNPYTQRIIRYTNNADLDLWAKPFNWPRDPAATVVELSNGRVALVGDLDYDLTNGSPCTKDPQFSGRMPQP